jgi:hypothetical protein
MSEKLKIVLIVSLITLLCVLGSRHVLAADYGVRFGPSIDKEGKTDGGTKVMGFRREERLMDGLNTAFELGGYVDNSGEGRKGAALGKVQLGVTPGMEKGIYGFGFLGPCIITAKDKLLGGYGQFCTDIGFGIRDKESFMTVGYSHISSAGLAMPNSGRDFLIFSAGLRFD